MKKLTNRSYFKKNIRKGFTLIEMMTVVAIIIILTTALTFSVSTYLGKAQSASSAVAIHVNKYDAAKNQVNDLILASPSTTPTPPPLTPTPTPGATPGATPTPPPTATPTPTPTPTATPTPAPTATPTPMPTATPTPTAVPTPSSYIVTFVYYDASGVTTSSQQTVNTGSNAVAPTIPTYPGYTFTVWSPATFTNITANLNVTATYTPKVYTATFNGNGGGTPSLPSKSVTIGSQYGGLATVARAGYAFNGWFTAASGGTKIITTTTVTITDDHTLYAQWTRTTCTATFDGNGGGTPSLTSKSVTIGSAYGGLATVARTGYTFNGWFTAASGGTKIITTTTVTITDDHTLYAHWTAKTFTVTFNKNGGSNPSPATKVVTYDSSYGTLATCTKSGKTFKGWYTATTGGTEITAATIVTITSNKTLYARWG